MTYENKIAIIYKADTQSDLQRAFQQAKERGLHIGIYTEPLLATKNEDENHLEISKFSIISRLTNY